jgi:sterol 3beta-glucosyltransferase
MLTLMERAVEMAGGRAVLALPSHSEPRSGEESPRRVADASLALSVTNNARIFLVGDVPHGWLFPRVRGAAHHGGAGTTAAALRAGVPQLLLPLAIDQFFWAERVAALGLGPAPLPQRSLTAEKLARGLEQLMNGNEMRERARAMREVMRGEAGVARAVEMITMCDALQKCVAR